MRQPRTLLRDDEMKPRPPFPIQRRRPLYLDVKNVRLEVTLPELDGGGVAVRVEVVKSPREEQEEPQSKPE